MRAEARGNAAAARAAAAAAAAGGAPLARRVSSASSRAAAAAAPSLLPLGANDDVLMAHMLANRCVGGGLCVLAPSNGVGA